MMNAYEDGSKLHLDVCLYDGPCFDFFPTPSGQSFPVPPPILTQFTFDLANGNDGYNAATIGAHPGRTAAHRRPLPGARLPTRLHGGRAGRRRQLFRRPRGSQHRKDGVLEPRTGERGSGIAICSPPAGFSRRRRLPADRRQPSRRRIIATSPCSMRATWPPARSRCSGCQYACGWLSTGPGFPPKRSAPAVMGWRSRDERPGNELICGNSFEASVPS